MPPARRVASTRRGWTASAAAGALAAGGGRRARRRLARRRLARGRLARRDLGVAGGVRGAPAHDADEVVDQGMLSLARPGEADGALRGVLDTERDHILTS